MVQFYKIAGLNVAMDSYGRALEQAEPYRVDTCDNVDLTIESNWPTVKANADSVYSTLSDSDGEYLATGYNFYKKLLDFNGMMLHSSAVVVDGKAYLFSANSGTGKSTHTGLWLKAFGDRAYILNDDKPAIRLEDGVWYAYGTPWSGKNDISRNERVPVAGIALIERGEKNEIFPYSGIDVFFEIFRQVNRPKDAAFRTKILELLDKLITQVPVWKLRCNMDPEAAIIAYEAMSGKRKED